MNHVRFCNRLAVPASWSKCVASLFVIALAVQLQGCDYVQKLARTQGNARQILPTIRTDAGIAGRSALTLAEGLCVVMHFPPSTTPGPPVDGSQLPTAEFIELQKSEMRLLPYGNVTTFNCVTFALADELQLEPTDWIEPFPRASTFYTDPAQTALDSAFGLVTEFATANCNWDELEHDPQILHGDVICYRQQVGDHGVIVHMGRICDSHEKHWVLSKIGVGPIIETSMAYCAETFRSDHVSIYRPLAKNP